MIRLLQFSLQFIVKDTNFVKRCMWEHLDSLMYIVLLSSTLCNESISRLLSFFTVCFTPGGLASFISLVSKKVGSFCRRLYIFLWNQSGILIHGLLVVIRYLKVSYFEINIIMQNFIMQKEEFTFRKSPAWEISKNWCW